MSSSDTLSAIALAVALVALIITISQVLGQFLATADGYRRCQPSVMGCWAQLTHRRFRWSEMRFETMYTTPTFALSTYTPGWPFPTNIDSRGREIQHFLLDGSSSVMKETYCEPFGYRDTELATRVAFIDALHGNSRDTLNLIGNTTSEGVGTAIIQTTEKNVEQSIGPLSYMIPQITMQERSWDFVPPEVIRPLAVITVSDIATMARRLGMIWKQFEPLDGNLRAEGNGHTVSSTAVRSIGTVLQLGIRDPLPAFYDTTNIDELYIPSEAADKLGFGIVPGQPSLGIPDYNLGTEDEILATLRNVVDPSHKTAETVKSILEANPGCTPGISDIIGFVAPMIRQPRSTIVRIPSPAGYAVGLTQQEEGFVVFRNRLHDLINERDVKGEPVTEQTRLILRHYDELRQRYGSQWEDQHICNRTLNSRSVAFLDDLHARHTAATQYFKDLTARYTPSDEKPQAFHYTNLMYSHIRHAVNYFEDALERLNANPSRGRDHYGMRVADWITEGAHIYFDNIPKIIDAMRAKGFGKPEIVEEAWLTMMFKAFLWHRCHFMVEGPRVPSSHWASTLSVYVG